MTFLFIIDYLLPLALMLTGILNEYLNILLENTILSFLTFLFCFVTPKKKITLC